MKMNEYLEKIEGIAKKIHPREITIMEVCGGHTNTIMKYGIRDILPKNIHLISGPGCPVCVTSQEDIDNMIELAKQGIKIATFGDMMFVRGSKSSLANEKAKGADILMIADASELLKKENKNRIFFSIGFETTTPISAYLLNKNICIYPTNKIMVPPMKALIETSNIDGFILPGHVSAIIGSKVWNKINKSQVICGFKQDQVIRAIYKILKLIYENKKEVINDYSEIVKSQGNKKARDLIRETMKLSDMSWRGFGVIPMSGMVPKDDNLNAKIKYKELLKNVKSIENKACKCSEILRGLARPKDCKLFGKVCTPKKPVGPCMVSKGEGACGIAYKYIKS